jgi:ribose transport system ATP-binding protein
VEIAAALSVQCRILILDEPTASLTETEAGLLFKQIEHLKRQGAAIVYISHRMEEIKKIADRVTILRDGRHVATEPVGRLSIEEIIQQMVGRPVGELRKASGSSRAGEVALRAACLSRGEWVKGVSFEAYRGEILGFAGLMGSGRTELMRLLFGADPPDGGELFLNGSDRPERIRSPREAVRRGIALLTEDRKSQGLLLPLPIRANLSLPSLRGLARLGLVNGPAEKSLARKYVGDLAIKCSSAEQLAGQLSGGNQQKVVLGKWLAKDAEILIFDEPTRGIDVGAKFEIYQILADLAARRKAVLVVSSDILELMAICDRIAVMSLGRLAGILPRGEWSQEKIMSLALSGHLQTNKRSQC